VAGAHASEDWRARVGVVLQSWRDHNRWRVRELLAHLGAHYGDYSTPSVGRPWNVDDLVAAVGLGGQADQPIRSLSGGQRRRLDVAIGVVGRPEVLFLDEPTAGFDPQARRECHDLILRLAREHATTILLTTHDLHEAEKLADRIMIINAGAVIADGTAHELARQIVGGDEVRWTCDGQHFARVTAESTRLVFDLFRQYGESIADLEVRRSSLEHTYLSLVRSAEEANG
jgi:ABC-2 type transport system ATP-binding protein